MPYKDPAKKREHDKRRAEMAKIRRVQDPEFAKKEREARKKWYEKTYKGDETYRLVKNKKRVLSRYGLKIKDYERLLDLQDYKCLICKAKHKDLPGKRLVVDHDHQKSLTSIRGLLCGQCNLGLGLFRDSPQALRAAALYLEQNQ